MSERLEKALIGLSIAAVIVLVLIMTVPFGERSEPNIWPCSHTASSMCPSNMITGRVYSEVVNFGWLAFLLAVEWLVLTELCFFAGRGVDKLSAVGFGLTRTLVVLLLAFFIRDVYFSFGEFVNTLLGWTGFIVWMCVFALGGLALFEGWCWFERKNEEWFKWLKAK